MRNTSAKNRDPLYRSIKPFPSGVFAHCNPPFFTRTAQAAGTLLCNPLSCPTSRGKSHRSPSRDPRKRGISRAYGVWPRCARPHCLLFPRKATRPLRSCCFRGNTMSVRYGVCERLPVRTNRRYLRWMQWYPTQASITRRGACVPWRDGRKGAAALRGYTSTEAVPARLRVAACVLFVILPIREQPLKVYPHRPPASRTKARFHHRSCISREVEPIWDDGTPEYPICNERHLCCRRAVARGEAQRAARRRAAGARSLHG